MGGTVKIRIGQPRHEEGLEQLENAAKKPGAGLCYFFGKGIFPMKK
ncbi:hypothetical protein B4135_2210 [Caldibacillus debilis]|uniref:Uncharacterized protein n=1 Tax=Caldibacillus debilis TaxID=301148 RepID=A0A150M2A3_9BACI|nr:hypothetical protein B4135_2210 [Caldibacillus debilis]